MTDAPPELSSSPAVAEPGLHVVWRHARVQDGTIEQAAPVLLVHGVLDSARSFAKLTRRIGDDRTVVAYDRRGYQRSRTSPVRSPALAANVTDLAAIVDLLDGASPIVFGHSYGGLIALVLAATGAVSLDGVVVYEPPVSWLPWWDDEVAAGREPRLSPRAREAPAAFAHRFVATMLGEERFARLDPAIVDGLGRDGPAAAVELAELGDSQPFDPAAIDLPVTVVRGASTSARHVRGTEWLAAAIPDARLVVLDGATHGGHLSHPAELAHVILGSARA